MIATETLKLNLGGRTTSIPGFKVVDLYEGEGVDIRSDVSKLPMDDNSVEEIYASHVLEHFSHRKTVDVLKEWHRVLVPGKRLYISVPDFNEAIEVYKKYGMVDVVRNMLYGDQIYPLAFHYVTFTFATLAKACMEAGFSDIKRLKSMPYGIQDCSVLVYTELKNPISINVEVTK